MTHEREKVNNVIKIFLCFVIDFMNVCFLHFTKKKKLESKISNSTYFSSRRSRFRDGKMYRMRIEYPWKQGVQRELGLFGGRNKDKESKGERMAGKR